MNGRFEGHVAVVTGAGSGIGLGIARRFAREGARVAILEQDAESAQAAAAVMDDAEAFLCDVSHEATVAHAIQKVLARFGAIDHVVNNAGIVLVKPVEQTSVEEWDRVMGVNVRSIFLMAKYTVDVLRRSPAPTIVNIGSVSSFVGQKHTPAYVASKGAVAMLSKALALDFAQYGIRVNCVCPGITDTPMFRAHVNQTPDPERTLRERCNRIPLGRMLAPDDIANGVLYLSSADSAGITGTTLVVDAGYLAAAEWNNS
jgi:NAD(P)-dependent dehydrogenase (short-subunit alcohol dehydrogenase family)